MPCFAVNAHENVILTAMGKALAFVLPPMNFSSLAQDSTRGKNRPSVARAAREPSFLADAICVACSVKTAPSVTVVWDVK